VATLGGPTMFARIGVMRALNRHVERVFNPDRKDHHCGQAEAEERPGLKMPAPPGGAAGARSEAAVFGGQLS